MSGHFGLAVEEESENREQSFIVEPAEVLMGQLPCPELREKYTRQELVDLTQKYEDICEEIHSFENLMRETTFKQAED